MGENMNILKRHIFIGVVLFMVGLSILFLLITGLSVSGTYFFLLYGLLTLFVTADLSVLLSNYFRMQDILSIRQNAVFYFARFFIFCFFSFICLLNVCFFHILGKTLVKSSMLFD